MKRTMHACIAVFLVSAFAAAVSAQTADAGQRVYTGKDAAAVITDAISRQDAVSDIQVSIDQARDEDIIAQDAGLFTAEADGVTIDKARNRWQATLMLKTDAHALAPIRLTGRYEEMATLPVLKRHIQSGEIISQDDIDWSKEPLSHLRKNTVTDMHDLIGKSPKHVITQGRAIRLDEIASPAIVNKGMKVTLMYKSHNIEIETYGEAMEPGARGDVIRVRNSASKIIVQGTVESSDRVRVTSPETDAAEAM